MDAYIRHDIVRVLSYGWVEGFFRVYLDEQIPPNDFFSHVCQMISEMKDA